MPRLDPSDLRAYAARDWGAPERLARAERARRPRAEKIALGIELYESARRTCPAWPTEADRRADLEAHRRLKRLLDRARHVGAR